MNKKFIMKYSYILCVLFTILSSYSIFFIKKPIVVYISILLSAIIYILMSITQLRRMPLSEVLIIITFIMTVLILVSFGKDYLDLTFQIIALLFVIYFIILMNASKKNLFDNFLEAYEMIVFYISLISLFFYTFGTIIKLIAPSGYIDDIDWSSNYYNYKNFYWLYFEGQSTSLFNNIFMRNMSVFAEGPIFSCILTIALYIELFICKKGKIYLTIILIAMFTTLSTTSLSIGSVLLFIKFYNRYLKNKRLIVIMPVILVIVAWFVFLIIDDKLRTTISGNIRIDDVKACFLSWLDSPLIGNGFQNIGALNPARALWRGSSAGNSTGIGGVLSNGGVVLGFWYCVPFGIAIAKFKNKKMQKYNGLVLLIFVIFFVMIMHFTALGSFLLALQWSIVMQNKNRSIEKNRRLKL